jgi:glutathione S-transferase
MQHLEDAFPDAPSLLPGECSAEITEFLDTFNDTSRSIFIALRPSETPTDEDKAAIDSLCKFLDDLEAQMEGNNGSYLFGAFSLADITVAPFMPQLFESENKAINLSKHPKVKAAMEALLARPSYKATAVDPHTRRVIRAAFFGGASATGVRT